MNIQEDLAMKKNDIDYNKKVYELVKQGKRKNFLTKDFMRFNNDSNRKIAVLSSNEKGR